MSELYVHVAMDTEDGGSVVEESNTKAAKGRRVWNNKEEEALIKCMRNEIEQKWRGDNGFRAGFFTLLEKELAKVLPESNIKASPHIASKIKGWKNTYNSIVDVIGHSGFGWDYSRHCVDVDSEVWKTYKEVTSKSFKLTHSFI